MPLIPLVAGVAFRERLAQLPAEFPATLCPEPESPYNPRAISVIGPTGKVGYVATESARELYEKVAGGEVLTCLVRQGHYSPTTGVLGILEI